MKTQGTGQRKKKTGFVPYDYESAFEHSCEMLAADEVARLLRDRKKCVHATKEIRAGNQLEVEIYPEFTKLPATIPRKKNTAAQKDLNDRNSQKECVRTINENFGTDIKDYVAVDFEQLVQIVDAIGGVDIDVQNDNELKELNRVIKDYGAERGKEFSGVEKTGLQTLDGVQALCYGRIRKGDTGDDWARVERQSVVLNAIFTKLQSASATELIGSMRKLVPYVTTSLSPTDMASLIVGAVKNGIPTLEHTRIPVDGEWSYSGNSSEFITYDLDVAADHIHAYIYDDADIGSGTTDDDTGTDSKSDTDTGTDTTDSSKSTDTKSNTTAVDPESLVEEGGWYDSDTGDYYDCDGDRYSLDENGNKVYY